MVFGRPLKELRWLEEAEERRSGEALKGGEGISPLLGGHDGIP